MGSRNGGVLEEPGLPRAASTDFIRPQAIDGLEREAREVVYWDQLPSIRCPVLILRGLVQDGPTASNLTAEDSDRYRRLLPDAEEIVFGQSGHMVPDDEPDKYGATWFRPSWRSTDDDRAPLPTEWQHELESDRGVDAEVVVGP